jgi:CHAT domain-containing protein
MQPGDCRVPMNLLLLPVLLISVVVSLQAQSLKNAPTDKNHPLPAAFSQRMDSLRKSDNLEEWLYEWMDYVKEAPEVRSYFLSFAESSAWRPDRNDNERLAWFYLLANLGYYQLYSGNILGSIDGYEKAYRFYFEKPLASADVIEYVLKPLGNNYTRLGDYDRAFFIQEKSLVLALAGKDSTQAAGIYNNMAISARWKGDLPQATEYCERGLQIVGNHASLHGLLLSTMADVLLQSKQMDEAEIRVLEAVRILHTIRGREGDAGKYWLMSAYQVQGNLFKERNNLSSALFSYKLGLDIANHYFRGQRKREKAKLELSIGEVQLLMHHPAMALHTFDESLSILLPAFHPLTPASLPEAKDLYGENTLLDALEGKAKSLLAAGNTENALECFLLSFEVDRMLRREFFSRAAKEQQQKENRVLAELAIETAYELWQKTGKNEYANDVLRIAENSKAQLLLDEMSGNQHYSQIKIGDTLLERRAKLLQAIAYFEREEVLGSSDSSAIANARDRRRELQYELSLLQKLVKEKYPMTEMDGMNQSTSKTNDFLQGLPDSLSVLEYFSGEQATYIIRAKAAGVLQIRRLNNAGALQQEIKDFISKYFQNGPVNMINQPGDYFVRAFHIYKQLCDSVMDKGDYLIVPDGMIGYLPFDALLTDSLYHPNIDRWPFLIRRASISFAYSLQTRRVQLQSDKPGKLFAGYFISYDSSKKESIPAVLKECSDIRAVVKGNFYTENEARYDRFLQSLQEVNILHISSHSFLQGSDKLPVLQLADGRFFLFELYEHEFKPQLVVLSACRTGYGMLSEGEGIISLSRGFTAGGAGGIIAGLWNMNDESTATLMGYFYQQLIRENQPSIALREGKLEWLAKEHDNPFMKLPYFWAGSVYCGNDRPVSIDGRTSVSYYWWIALGLCGLLLVVLILPATRKARRSGQAAGSA